MHARYYTVDVFTDQMFGGNQLAVFPDASGIPSDVMPRITREFNYSETTFVLPPTNPKHAAKVRIFTPGAELQFAGHPTVGTAHVLALVGAIKLTGDETKVVLEEGVGPVPVTIRSAKGTPVFAELSVAKLPEVGPPAPSIEHLAKALSLDPSELVGGDMSPEGVSCGTPFLFVPLRNRAAVASARVNMDAWDRYVSPYYAPQIFLFAMEGERPGSNVRARMYAPGLGVPEDPATGSAAVGMGGYLAARSKQRDGTLRWTVEQGFEMGRPSILKVEVDKRDGKVSGVRVGGASVLVCEGEIRL